MSKKSKHKQRRSTTTQTTNITAVTTVATPPKLSRGTSKEETFSPDYSHVIRDLKRIGVLAGSFIIILIVLSFFLR